jgi:hypothetical protein
MFFAPKADPVYETKDVTRGTEVTINAFWNNGCNLRIVT